jgi:peptidoglycan/LPS O-acetylase OafA/YrhL
VLAAVLFGALPSGLERALDWRPLAALGVASYSLYLWHQPLLARLELETGLGFLPLLAVGLPLCAAVAAVTYLTVERPFLRMRRRWTPPVSRS